MLRSGIATLWLILVLPCIVVMLCVVVEISNLWIARAELEDALEAAALAAVKEWGDNGGGDTLGERIIGVEYAAANTVRNTPVVVADNYDGAAANPNQNNQCVMLDETPPVPPILIFGAIVDDETPHTFDTTVRPTCSGGWPVLFDASSNSSLQQESAWGINFEPRESVDEPVPDLTISRIVYDLLPPGHKDTGNDAYFDFFNVEPPNNGVTLANLTDPPVISNVLSTISTPDCAATQLDMAGLDLAPLTTFDLGGGLWEFSNSQIRFLFDTSDPSKLTIEFLPIIGDIGLEPGDRLRFGAKVSNLKDEDFKPPNSENDGDSVGRVGVQVEVTFAVAGTDLVPSSTATFVDSTFGANNSPPVPPHIDCETLANFPYVLPHPPASGNKNDDQSYVELTGSGDGDPFGVHAVGTVHVNTVCLNLFGLMGSSFPVSARATAMFDCKEHVPRLIRIDELICP